MSQDQSSPDVCGTSPLSDEDEINALSPSMLAWLRCFDAATRCASFAKAAQELHVSQGAVGQQVKRLEDKLNQVLLLRKPGGLTLTPEGEQLYAATNASFRNMGMTVQQLRTARQGVAVNLSCSPSFTVMWLTMRLGRLYQLHPQLALNIVTESAEVDAANLARDDLAAAIRLARPGVAAGTCNLVDEWLVPVATPDFLSSHADLRTPADLKGSHLIHGADPWESGSPTDGWGRWLTAYGIAFPAAALQQGTQFNLSLLGVHAALDGQGIAMGRMALVHHYLVQGKLVVPFRNRLLSRPCYRFYGNPGHPHMPTIRQWLEDEAAAYRTQRDAFFDREGISVLDSGPLER